METRPIGVPITVLHAAEGRRVTIETVAGEVFRGKLVQAEDDMNCHMSDVVVTYRDGKTANLDNVYMQGRRIRYLILPDDLKSISKYIPSKSKTMGRGKAALLRATRGRARGRGAPWHGPSSSGLCRR